MTTYKFEDETIIQIRYKITVTTEKQIFDSTRVHEICIEAPVVEERDFSYEVQVFDEILVIDKDDVIVGEPTVPVFPAHQASPYSSFEEIRSEVRESYSNTY